MSHDFALAAHARLSPTHVPAMPDAEFMWNSLQRAKDYNVPPTSPHSERGQQLPFRATMHACMHSYCHIHNNFSSFTLLKSLSHPDTLAIAASIESSGSSQPRDSAVTDSHRGTPAGVKPRPLSGYGTSTLQPPCVLSRPASPRCAPSTDAFQCGAIAEALPSPTQKSPKREAPSPPTLAAAAAAATAAASIKQVTAGGHGHVTGAKATAAMFQLNVKGFKKLASL